eukprot:6184710-Pleurochrysis_carterae.AAC.1
MTAPSEIRTADDNNVGCENHLLNETDMGFVLIKDEVAPRSINNFARGDMKIRGSCASRRGPRVLPVRAPTRARCAVLPCSLRVKKVKRNVYL